MAINIDTQGKKCENCKHWDRRGVTLLGKCSLVSTQLTNDVQYRIYHDKVNSFPFGSSDVLTGQQFFCLLHNIELKK